MHTMPRSSTAFTTFLCRWTNRRVRSVPYAQGSGRCPRIVQRPLDSYPSSGGDGRMNALSILLTAVFWWLVSFVLIVTSQTSPGVHDVPLLESTPGSQIAGMSAWHSPLTIYWPGQTGRRVSVWTASALAAAMIAGVTASLRTATTPLLCGLVLICLSSAADIRACTCCRINCRSHCGCHTVSAITGESCTAKRPYQNGIIRFGND